MESTNLPDSSSETTDSTLEPADANLTKQRLARAKQLSAQVENVAKTNLNNDWKLAELLSEINDEQYFVNLGFRSFKSFVQEKCGFLCFSKADKLMRLGRRCFQEHKIDPCKLQNVQISKAFVLTPHITADNCDELISLAETHSLRELKRVMRQRVNGDSASEVGQAGGQSNGTSLIQVGRPIAPSSDNWRGFLSRRPAQDDFYVEEDVWEQLVFAATHEQSVLLIGPAGCGKSEIVARVAKTVGTSLEAFNLGNCADPRATFLGTTQLKNGQTKFYLSQFASAFQNGCSLFLLDELNRCHPESANILLTALDNQGYLAFDDMGGGQRISRGPAISFFSTANLGAAYTGTDQIDHALLDRQKSVIELDFPPVTKEARILVKRNPGLDKSSAAKLTQVAEAQREQFETGEFSTAISTRQLLAAAEQVRVGISLEDAFKFCVLQKFQAEGGEESERAQLEKLFQGF